MYDGPMNRGGRGQVLAQRMLIGLCALVVLGWVAVMVLVRVAPTSEAESDPAAEQDHASPTGAPSAGDPGVQPPASTPPAGSPAAGGTAPQSGWGAAQPTQMRATVQHGVSSEPMSPERRDLLGQQLQRVREVALGIGTVAEAERLGFVKNFQRIDGRGFEYVNWSWFSPTLNLDRPTMLLFADDKPDSRVISVAYNVLGVREAGPPHDLPLEVVPWHYHSNLCKKDGTIIGSIEYSPTGEVYADQVERCVREGAEFRPELNHWMVDFWVIPGWENPWGVVSSKHPDQFATPQPWFNDSNAPPRHH